HRPQPGEAPQEATARRRPGRHHREGNGPAHRQGHGDLQELQQADTRRVPDPRRRQAPHLQAVRPGYRLMATPRLKERYKTEIAPELMREFSYSNVMQVPHVAKVTINIGLGEARDNARAVESATAD